MAFNCGLIADANTDIQMTFKGAQDSLQNAVERRMYVCKHCHTAYKTATKHTTPLPLKYNTAQQCYMLVADTSNMLHGNHSSNTSMINRDWQREGSPVRASFCMAAYCCC